MVQGEAGDATSGTAPVDGTRAGTRERILDIAQELFTSQGYESTSLREIAERLGFTKAAIYYHFASKEEILMALHGRVHDIGAEILGAVDLETMSVDDWIAVLERLIEQLIAHRQLFILHERNRTAMEKLHDDEHQDQHNDLEVVLRRVMSNPAMPLEDRVRIGCAFGASFFGLVLTADSFPEATNEELAAILTATVTGIVRPRG